MATISTSDYQLKPNETIAQYNARIASSRGDSADDLSRANQLALTYANANSSTTNNARLGLDAGTQTANTNSRSLNLAAPVAPTAPTYNAPVFNTSPVVQNTGPDPFTTFNTALMGLLTKQQQLGTRGFQEQGLNAQQAQNNATLAPTASNLVGAASSVQDSVRGNQAQAYQPLVAGANNAAQTFSEQIGSLGNAINAAKSFGDSYQAHQDSMQAQARENITQAMQIGGAAGLAAIQKANPNIFKVAGLDYDSLEAAANAQEKYSQAQTKYQSDYQQYQDQLNQYNANRQYTLDSAPTPTKPIEVSAGNTLYDPSTGKPLYTAPKSYAPTSNSTSNNNAVNLSAAAKEDLVTMGTVQQLANQLLSKYAASGNQLAGTGGLFSGSIQSLLSHTGIGNQDEQQNRDLVGNILATIAKLRGGTSFTPNEQALLQTYAPTINDPDWKLAQKLTDLNQFINLKRQQTLQAGSGNFTSPMIRVRDKSTGQTGSLPESEYDPALYEKI